MSKQKRVEVTVSFDMDITVPFDMDPEATTHDTALQAQLTNLQALMSFLASVDSYDVEVRTRFVHPDRPFQVGDKVEFELALHYPGYPRYSSDWEIEKGSDIWVVGTVVEASDSSFNVLYTDHEGVERKTYWTYEHGKHMLNYIKLVADLCEGERLFLDEILTTY